MVPLPADFPAGQREQPSMRYSLDIAIRDYNGDRHDSLRSVDIDRAIDCLGSEIPDLPGATMAQGIPAWAREGERNRARRTVQMRKGA
jgi:hypothetical protein